MNNTSVNNDNQDSTDSKESSSKGSYGAQGGRISKKTLKIFMAQSTPEQRRGLLSMFNSNSTPHSKSRHKR